mmetsp:Transcript_129709/g.361264  ORF Transcript_129709/g.361264 Transcript_129709/m.361264 type:complete len:249 (-) Transcript_129709:205-951(-)
MDVLAPSPPPPPRPPPPPPLPPPSSSKILAKATLPAVLKRSLSAVHLVPGLMPVIWTFRPSSELGCCSTVIVAPFSSLPSSSKAAAADSASSIRTSAVRPGAALAFFAGGVFDVLGAAVVLAGAAAFFFSGAASSTTAQFTSGLPAEVSLMVNLMLPPSSRPSGQSFSGNLASVLYHSVTTGQSTRYNVGTFTLCFVTVPMYCSASSSSSSATTALSAFLFLSTFSTQVVTGSSSSRVNLMVSPISTF